jgi:2-keto-3-deoxy-L-rhamnonate aldolase RhmA
VASHETQDGDVWIDAPIQTTGVDPRFYGMATVSHHWGLNGPATASVKFNLTAYIRHMIEAANGKN